MSRRPSPLESLSLARSKLSVRAAMPSRVDHVAVRAMVLDEPGRRLQRRASCPIRARARAPASCWSGPRVRRVPHRPAHPRRRGARLEAARGLRPPDRRHRAARASGAGGRASASRGWAGLRECRFCRSGRENLCERARFTGARPRRRLRRRTRWPTRATAFALPDGFGDLEAAPLLCAGLIGHRALRMTGDAAAARPLRLRRRAHIVCQVARHQGRRVFAFTRAGDDASQAFALELGCEWAGDVRGRAAGGARRGDHLRPRRRARPGRAARGAPRAAPSSAPAST